MAQRYGTMRGMINGHGQFEMTFKSFEALAETYADYSLERLFKEIKELQGDPYYDTSDLTRTECLLILGEMHGMATN